MIKEICSWLQTFCPSNPIGGSQEHISLITNSFLMFLLFWVVFMGFDPINGKQYQPISQKFHLRVIAVPAVYYLCWCLKLPGQKRCDEEEAEEKEEHEFWGVFDVFLK